MRMNGTYNVADVIITVINEINLDDVLRIDFCRKSGTVEIFRYDNQKEIYRRKLEEKTSEFIRDTIDGYVDTTYIYAYVKGRSLLWKVIEVDNVEGILYKYRPNRRPYGKQERTL